MIWGPWRSQQRIFDGEGQGTLGTQCPKALSSTQPATIRVVLDGVKLRFNKYQILESVTGLTMRTLIPLLFVALLLGCDSRLERFQRNSVHALTLAASRGVETQSAAADVDAVVHDLFGSPEEPKWPAELLGPDLAAVVDLQNLERAAGRVSSDQMDNHKGLYIENCVTCHGLDGSGAGPAAMLQNPYPRDFRSGVFKWKSTARSEKPTREDLQNLLINGVPGTGMPSFAASKSEDREALIDYLIYLSIRGETERRLLAECVDEIGYDDQDPLPDDQRLNRGHDSVRATLRYVTASWVSADPKTVAVPGPTFDADSGLQESIARGKDIFHSQIANCVGCHGPEGNGKAITLDYDDWAKEYTSRIGITPSDRDAVKPFRKAGALRPRQIKPRNLQLGNFRGGGSGVNLYHRISQGIAGTPMPAITVSDTESTKGLSNDQVWDLIHYVQSLSNRTN